MAMMMTGRVLLVCALCVLWCGAGGACDKDATRPAGSLGASAGGGRVEATPASSDTTPENKPQKEKGAVGVTGKGDQKGQLEAPKETPKASEIQELPSNSSQAPQSGGGASVTASETTDNQDQKEEDNKEKKKEEAKQQEEAKDEEEEEEEVKVELDGANEEGDTKEEETVTGITGGMPAGGQEQPSLSSAAEGASNITNPNSTQTPGDDDPAADSARTAEGKQNENKDANPKETPLTAAATKNTTATTGDSDGSTAVSHTTSSLLLLLVVACAAAAAVVAA
ncbi:mucin-associated surface protein [Trypanosoma cruzi cruzi]|uniref:Mucin-associated surface protein (MASP) n=1 Tax=Trypanosoma cruzi TaxID=5693 RepID=A0A2V2VTK3_TRYCR|nr:mucin-associated surface protein [Trypanosoma cruzi cruzi]PWU98782.1 Mucin-associated surface protein (MASP) [Trypanosoma cruzi]